jgi:hypothetical protein
VDCLVSVDCFWHSDRFYSMNPSDSGACDIFLYSDIFFNFFKNYKFLSYKCFICFIRVTPKYFILFEAIMKDVLSLISFSVCLSFVHRRVTGFWNSILYPVTFLKVFISCRNFLVEFLFVLNIFIRYFPHLHYQSYPKSPTYPPPTPLPTHSHFLALAFPCTEACIVCMSNGPLFQVMAD